MLLRAFPNNLIAKAIMKLELDPRDASSFKYNTVRNYILDKCVTADSLTLWD